ncbi:MAG: hypothetical protein JW982_08120 [Spirochaetes bacterium]|nr:hypothetical protein [Spirochaetota bacterium]
MKKLIISLIISASSVIFAQNVNQINVIQEIDEKPAATYEDAVTMFMYELNQTPGTFERNAAFLKTKQIVKKDYAKETPLKRGMIAYMTAKHLNLKDSFMFALTKAERYAFRSCVSYGIMDVDGSENDLISGNELLEIFQKISDFRGENQ